MHLGKTSFVVAVHIGVKISVMLEMYGPACCVTCEFDNFTFFAGMLLVYMSKTAPSIKAMM